MATRYDEEGFNARGRRRIGYKPRTTRDTYGGLNEYYALQDRRLSPSAANELGSRARQSDLSIVPGERGMDVVPRTQGSRLSTGRRPLASMRQEAESPTSSWVQQTLNGGMPLATESANNPAAIRQRLQARANEIRMQREMQPSVVQRSSPDAIAVGAPSSTLRSQYGTGSATTFTPQQFAARPEATIGGQPASSFFQDAADRQGVANKFASPKTMDPKKWRDALSRRGTLTPTRSTI